MHSSFIATTDCSDDSLCLTTRLDLTNLQSSQQSISDAEIITEG